MPITELRVKELLREKGWTTKMLAEKTGMSESYLTHIKNGTRRWNEDVLKRLAGAFGVHPIDLFVDNNSPAHATTGVRGGDSRMGIKGKVTLDANLANQIEDGGDEEGRIKPIMVPVMRDIPTHPSNYNNRVMQVATGFKNIFVPVVGFDDEHMFCVCVENSTLKPTFLKGDYIICSPSAKVVSGDIVAVEFGNKERQKQFMQITYTDEFVILESLNNKGTPVALTRAKDYYRIIGKAVLRYQKMDN